MISDTGNNNWLKTTFSVLKRKFVAISKRVFWHILVLVEHDSAFPGDFQNGEWAIIRLISRFSRLFLFKILSE
jgi:hypothetical protein